MRMRIAVTGAVIGTTAGIMLGRTIRWWRQWGYDAVEAAKGLPGDELVPAPTAIDTRGITIDAPPEAVWPWLVQMGYDRAGWYSYDQLDMRGKSIDRIEPAWQDIKVGDLIPNSPGGAFEVRVVEPGRALALYLDTELVARQSAVAASVGPDAPAMPAGLAASDKFLRTTPTDFAAVWSFVLEPLEDGRTRLIERVRARFGAGGPGFRFVGPVLGFGVFVMMQRQMLGIRERAIRTAVSRPAPAPVAPAAPRPKSNGRVTEEPGRTDLVAAAT